ncbi:MAG: hypothetical protein PWQ96_174 [Clostridia bacterium]|nr:hypothetical protein [Clostridia bacterium]
MAWFLAGLRNEAMRLTKKHRQIQEHELLILNELLSQDAEDEEMELLDTVRSTRDTPAEVEDKLYLQDTLWQHQKVIKATILEGATELEVAKKLGMSQPAVHKMKDRALNRLRKNLVLDESTAKSLIQDAQYPCRKAGSYR